MNSKLTRFKFDLIGLCYIHQRSPPRYSGYLCGRLSSPPPQTCWPSLELILTVRINRNQRRVFKVSSSCTTEFLEVRDMSSESSRTFVPFCSVHWKVQEIVTTRSA